MHIDLSSGVNLRIQPPGGTLRFIRYVHRNLSDGALSPRECFFAMDLTTPALLFPAISLLLLAYTNRFIVITQLIRHMHSKNQENLTDAVVRQIANLGLRITLIRRMQAMGVLSFLFCALSMFLLFIEQPSAARYVFGASIFLLVVSLFLSLYEILISTKAIEIELKEIERNVGKRQAEN